MPHTEQRDAIAQHPVKDLDHKRDHSDYAKDTEIRTGKTAFDEIQGIDTEEISQDGALGEI